MSGRIDCRPTDLRRKLLSVIGTLLGLGLCSSSLVSMDGTFNVCPKIFYQLYIIPNVELFPCGTSQNK